MRVLGFHWLVGRSLKVSLLSTQTWGPNVPPVKGSLSRVGIPAGEAKRSFSGVLYTLGSGPNCSSDGW